MTSDPFARPETPSTSNLEPEGTRAPMERGRYLLPRGAGGKTTRHTRATNFAKTIADTYLLSLWQQRMAVKGVTMDPSLYAAVASTSLEQRNELNGLVEKAKEVAGSASRARLGSALHAFSEQHDRGQAPVVPPPWDRDIAAYDEALSRLGLTILPAMPGSPEVPGIELTVYVEKYDVAGTFDRLAEVTKPLDVRVRDPKTGTVRTVHLEPGDVIVLDLKTGRTLDFGWGEIAVQLALYANAGHYFDPVSRSMKEMPRVRRDVAFVVHLPVGEAKATVHGLNIEVGWTACWLVEQVRTFRRVKDLNCVITEVIGQQSTAMPEDGPIVVTSERMAAYEDEISGATTITGLQRIKIRAERAGAWTTSLEVQAGARANELRKALTA